MQCSQSAPAAVPNPGPHTGYSRMLCPWKSGCVRLLPRRRGGAGASCLVMWPMRFSARLLGFVLYV